MGGECVTASGVARCRWKTFPRHDRDERSLLTDTFNRIRFSSPVLFRAPTVGFPSRVALAFAQSNRSQPLALSAGPKLLVLTV
jgi:hypothetical protein